MPRNERSDSIAALLGELRAEGIGDKRVLAAIGRVPRERFVPKELQAEAWANGALPIGAGQTISQPYVVALMTQALGPRPTDRVLEIGTGSGYQTAVLAELAGAVVSIERHPALATTAEERLSALGYRNIVIHIGDGTVGWPDNAPYDAIIVTAAAPRVPSPLLDQLSPDRGRLVIPVGELRDQDLYRIERRGERTHERLLGPVRFVPLIGHAGWEATE
ncbi:MAG: protein-L-isoaspartate(D-aspartate) O-methyltransferase [Chloroflexota bacterium]|nr:protein-L-isoaspartate(D-aspartate) O-methyltransferase [Chloroflexota bacterium]